MKAIALNANLADPHAMPGFIRMLQYWDWAGGNQFKRARTRQVVTAHQWYALFHALRGNPYDAEREIAQALQLALIAMILSDQGEILYYSGRSGAARSRQCLQNVLKQYPYSYGAHGLLISAYWKNGQADEAN
jgi:hypothetical protein